MTKPENGNDLLDWLRSLIGRHVHYEQQRYQIIDIVLQDFALVLQCDQPVHAIQANQYGSANRRVLKTVTLPVFEKQTNEFSDDFLRFREHNGL